MAGNVAEWVSDRYDPASKNGEVRQFRVVKGGGSDSYPSAVRPAARRGFEPDFRYFSIGFRCAGDSPLGKGVAK